MKRALTELAREFPDLSPARRLRLANAGLRNRNDIDDLVRSDPQGGPKLARYLDIEEDSDLLKATGRKRWPEGGGVNLEAMYPLGGVLAPTDEMVKGRRPGIVAASPRRLPASASLIRRYGPARSQGNVGSCTAFGTVCVLEGQQAAVTDLSEALVYHLTKKTDGHEDTDGSWLRYSMRVLSDYGTCREETWPYHDDRDYLRQTPSENAFAEAVDFRVHSPPLELEPTNCAAVRGEIAAGRPVALSVPIFRSSINSTRFHHQGHFLMKLGILDTVAGYHAMAGVAYVDDSWLAQHGLPEEPGGGALLVRNSWGPNWARENGIARLLGGEAGYGVMPFAYVESYCFEAFTVAVTAAAARRHRRGLADQVRLAGSAWWRHARDGVVTQARQRLEEQVT